MMVIFFTLLTCFIMANFSDLFSIVFAQAAQQDNVAHTFKVVLIGDGGVGKTSIIGRLLGLEFETRYLPTMGWDVYELILNTNVGYIKFEVVDTAGTERQTRSSSTST